MNNGEIAYYRAVEDHFALLRGTPFLFSPRDFALLNQWWKAGVPLGAILAGLGEVFERRREGDEDPVSSLTYCRHAVARQAKRLAAARVGDVPADDIWDPVQRLSALVEAVRRCARVHGASGAVVRVMDGLAAAIESLPAAAPAASLDEALARLEATALDSLLQSFSGGLAAEVRRLIDAKLAGVDLHGDAEERTLIALRRKAVREVLGLPRLEL